VVKLAKLREVYVKQAKHTLVSYSVGLCDVDHVRSRIRLVYATSVIRKGINSEDRSNVIVCQ